MRCNAAQLSTEAVAHLASLLCPIVRSSACGLASPTLRSCSTCPCCFRGELAAASHAVYPHLSSQTPAAWRWRVSTCPVLLHSASAQTGWKSIPCTRGAQPTATHAAHQTRHVACSRPQHARRTPRSEQHGAQRRCSSAPARCTRRWRGLAQRSRRSQCKRTSTHSTRQPAASHSVWARARVRPSTWRLARRVATTCATLHLLPPWAKPFALLWVRLAARRRR
jgi:hypothetical protein